MRRKVPLLLRNRGRPDCHLRFISGRINRFIYQADMGNEDAVAKGGTVIPFLRAALIFQGYSTQISGGIDTAGLHRCGVRFPMQHRWHPGRKIGATAWKREQSEAGKLTAAAIYR